jgi:glycosyltransferase involved in cell wall biosynthesis
MEVMLMSRDPLVSIVVPCYATTEKHAELLRETLATVATQTCGDYEIVLVDDGSSVDLGEVAASHSGTVIHRQSNSGLAVGRNAGIALSRGRYIVFLDADDHLLPRALEAGLAALAAHPECGFVVGAREEMTFEGLPVTWSVPPPPQQTHLYKPLLGFDWYIIPPSSVMFRREVVDAIGGFQDPWGADDLDFYLRAAYRFPAWCHQSPAVTRYRRYSASSSRDGERMLHSTRAVYARQWPLVQGDPDGEAAYHRGLRRLTEIFLDCLIENVEDRLRLGDRARALRAARLLASESPERWQRLVSDRGNEAASLIDDVGSPA